MPLSAQPVKLGREHLITAAVNDYLFHQIGKRLMSLEDFAEDPAGFDENKFVVINSEDYFAAKSTDWFLTSFPGADVKNLIELKKFLDPELAFLLAKANALTAEFALELDKIKMTVKEGAGLDEIRLNKLKIEYNSRIKALKAEIGKEGMESAAEAAGIKQRQAIGERGA